MKKIKISLTANHGSLCAKCEIVTNSDKLDGFLCFNIFGMDVKTLRKLFDITETPTKAILYKKDETNGIGFQNFVDFLITSIKNLSDLEIEIDSNIVADTSWTLDKVDILDRYNKFPTTGSGVTYYGTYTGSNTSNNLVYKPPISDGTIITNEVLQQLINSSNEI